MWRPENWGELREGAYEKALAKVHYDMEGTDWTHSLIEAGADAMLERLKKEG